MQNGKLNTEQRKALVKLVQSAYDRIFERQRKQYDDAIDQITREVKSELGVAKIERELKDLEFRTKELEAARERLGFSKYNDHPIPGSDAKRMIDKGLSGEKERTRCWKHRWTGQ